MKAMFKLVLLVIFFSSICFAANKEIKESILSLLPIGESTVSIMEIGLPEEEAKEMNELSAKIKKGMLSNYNWYLKYLKENEGKTLPYHPNLGVTKEEYSKYLDLINSLRLIKKGEGKIQINKDIKENITITAKSGVSLMDKIKINFKDNTVTTEYGTCIFKSIISASESQKVTEKWNGYSWRLIDIEKFKSIEFSLGKIEDKNEVIIYYDIKSAGKEKPFKGYEILLFEGKL